MKRPPPLSSNFKLNSIHSQYIGQLIREQQKKKFNSTNSNIQIDLNKTRSSFYSSLSPSNDKHQQQEQEEFLDNNNVIFLLFCLFL
jgi:hypothetical protein